MAFVASDVGRIIEATNSKGTIGIIAGEQYKVTAINSTTEAVVDILSLGGTQGVGNGLINYLQKTGLAGNSYWDWAVTPHVSRGAYDFTDSVNEIGNLASGIYKYDFDEDPSLVNPSFVSGWLQNNVGELNISIHSCYSGENPGMGDEEQNIYRQMFLRDFYKKIGRKSLMGVSYTSTNESGLVTSDWTELRDGDSVIRRRALLASPSEKITASRQFSELSKEANEELKHLLYKYNISKGGPRQIAGKDSSD